MYSDSCGPQWVPKLVRKALFGWFFEASCSRHDEGYLRGGDSKDRKKFDKKFLKAMLKDTKRTNNLTRAPKFVLAYVFYAAVRIGGPLSFNYK